MRILYQKHNYVGHYLFLVEEGIELNGLRHERLTTIVERLVPPEDLRTPGTLEFIDEEPTEEGLPVTCEQFPLSDPPWNGGTRIKVAINRKGYDMLLSERRIDTRIMQGPTAKITINIQAHSNPDNF